MGKKWLFSLAAVAAAAVFLPLSAKAADTQDMYRLYNYSTGEHFYTANAAEKENLRNNGWLYECIGWVAPKTSNSPVYRLYNKKTGLHHYTMSVAEKDLLSANNWSYEGIGWYSAHAKTVSVYREFNKKSGQHNFTTSAAEDKQLAASGWKSEGTAWYAVAAGRAVADADHPIIHTTQYDWWGILDDTFNEEGALETLGATIYDPDLWTYKEALRHAKSNGEVLYTVYHEENKPEYQITAVNNVWATGGGPYLQKDGTLYLATMKVKGTPWTLAYDTYGKCHGWNYYDANGDLQGNWHRYTNDEMEQLMKEKKDPQIDGWFGYTHHVTIG